MSRETKDSGTRTRSSTFGSPGGINHDASLFYGGRLYKDVIVEPQEFQEHELPEESLNSFYTHSSESRHKLPDSSVPSS